MLNKEFEIAGDKELADTKEWFFRENVRLAEEKERIFEERRKLEHEFRIKHDTLDKKMVIRIRKDEMFIGISSFYYYENFFS